GRTCCTQSLPYVRVKRIPRQGKTGLGGRQRRFPTGGAAYGTPLKNATGPTRSPSIVPPSTAARGLAGCTPLDVSAPVQPRTNASRILNSLSRFDSLAVHSWSAVRVGDWTNGLARQRPPPDRAVTNEKNRAGYC